MFDRLAKWYPYTGPGNWPDADMLPEGWLGPNPGWGEARQSRLTPDEQRTEFTLWAVTRSPLILGGNLTRLDDFTRSLLTNQTVLFVDQYATYSRPVDLIRSRRPAFKMPASGAPPLASPAIAATPNTSPSSTSPTRLQLCAQHGSNSASTAQNTPRTMSGTTPPPKSQKKSASPCRRTAALCSRFAELCDSLTRTARQFNCHKVTSSALTPTC